MMLNWRPLDALSPTALTVTNDNRQNIPFSQMPGSVFIEPQLPQDVEMVIPFFWPDNFLRCQLASDFSNMGNLYANIIIR
jgi:hypothetical protein